MKISQHKHTRLKIPKTLDILENKKDLLPPPLECNSQISTFQIQNFLDIYLQHGKITTNIIFKLDYVCMVPTLQISDLFIESMSYLFFIIIRNWKHYVLLRHYHKSNLHKIVVLISYCRIVFILTFHITLIDYFLTLNMK